MKKHKLSKRDPSENSPDETAGLIRAIFEESSFELRALILIAPAVGSVIILIILILYWLSI